MPDPVVTVSGGLVHTTSSVPISVAAATLQKQATMLMGQAQKLMVLAQQAVDKIQAISEAAPETVVAAPVVQPEPSPDSDAASN
jgi:hypothetical protein